MQMKLISTQRHKISLFLSLKDSAKMTCWWWCPSGFYNHWDKENAAWIVQAFALSLSFCCSCKTLRKSPGACVQVWPGSDQQRQTLHCNFYFYFVTGKNGGTCLATLAYQSTSALFDLPKDSSTHYNNVSTILPCTGWS